MKFKLISKEHILRIQLRKEDGTEWELHLRPIEQSEWIFTELSQTEEITVAEAYHNDKYEGEVTFSKGIRELCLVDLSGSSLRPACICSLSLIMNIGCICGAMDQEKAAKPKPPYKFKYY